MNRRRKRAESLLCQLAEITRDLGVDYCMDARYILVPCYLWQEVLAYRPKLKKA